MNNHLRFIKSGFIAFLFAVTALTSPASASEPPNVLFIAIDDMNDWTGYLQGHPQVKTPNLDQFARQGMVFRNTHCAAPICNPSRTAVLSGLSPHTTGVYLNGRGHDWKKSEPIKTAMALPQLFKENGYHTLWAGKIFHGRPKGPALKAMWDDMTHADGGNGPTAINDHVPETATRFKAFDWDEWENPDNDFADVNNTRKVIDFLKEEHAKPFFAAMGFYRPHNPWTAPKRYFSPFPMDQVKLPEAVADDLNDVPAAAIEIRDSAAKHDELVRISQDKPLVRAYLASIYFMDDLLGQILKALDESPYADNTIVVIWSDHGYHHGEKENWGKSALWEQTTRCLLTIRLPHGKSNGKSTGTPVNLLDLYPTLVDLCNLPQPTQQLDGLSLKPLLDDPTQTRKIPSITWYGADNVSVRSTDYRLIRYFDGSMELYDHRNDPREWNNLATDPEYKPIIDDLQKAIPQKRAAPVGQLPLGQKK